MNPVSEDSAADIVTFHLSPFNKEKNFGMTEVEINKSIKLSEHMKLGELRVTSVKTADGRSAQGDALLAKNIPSHVAIENLKRLCKWLEHLRRGWSARRGG